MKRSLTLLGGALLLFSAASAFGDTLVMHCIKSACTRIRCDDWQENCSAIGYYRFAHGVYSVPHAKWVCDEFGDCHFAPPSLAPIAARK